jgi:hypothetical protein
MRINFFVVDRIKLVMQRKLVLWIESNLWFMSGEIEWITHVMVKLLCVNILLVCGVFLFLSIPNCYELRRRSLSSRFAGKGWRRQCMQGTCSKRLFLFFWKTPLVPVRSTGTKGGPFVSNH